MSLTLPFGEVRRGLCDMKITCFIANQGEHTSKLIAQLRSNVSVNEIYILSKEECTFEGAACIVVDNLTSSNTLRQVAAYVQTEFCLFITDEQQVSLGQYAIDRLLQVAEMSASVLTYADYLEVKDGETKPHPTIDYQLGSVRDDFDFGPLQLYHVAALMEYLEDMEDTQYAAVYGLRLQASRLGKVFHLPELLSTKRESDVRQSGEKQFDYVNPMQRERQLEMEQVCTNHLFYMGAKLTEDEFQPVAFDGDFPVEASVVIPVKNRIKTIKDAVDSVLMQECDFRFNLLVVDNHSADGTKELLDSYDDERLIVITPEATDLGIGGCWNVAAHHEQAGRFLIQLDSDDLYYDNSTIQQVVDKFYEECCGMVIGSYQMCNFKLEEIPPGIIDHAEWTNENGPNNALRINGLGAPRAFFTPIFRSIRIPNTSYGEDYAMGLAISRNYQIGRIYNPIYRCRRWEDNSDASLDIQKQNAHNHYKDTIRTIELIARVRR